jgi:hypothetical protein
MFAAYTRLSPTKYTVPSGQVHSPPQMPTFSSSSSYTLPEVGREASRTGGGEASWIGGGEASWTGGGEDDVTLADIVSAGDSAGATDVVAGAPSAATLTWITEPATAPAGTTTSMLMPLGPRTCMRSPGTVPCGTRTGNDCCGGVAAAVAGAVVVAAVDSAAHVTLRKAHASLSQ